MKTEQAYSKIMNQFEIIHAENIAIYQAILTLCGIDDKTRDNMTDLWDKRFQDERKRYV